MATIAVSEREAPRFLHILTREIIDILILFSECHEIPPHVITRTVRPLRDELKRRELRGIDDPFDLIHDSVTQ